MTTGMTFGTPAARNYWHVLNSGGSESAAVEAARAASRAVFDERDAREQRYADRLARLEVEVERERRAHVAADGLRRRLRVGEPPRFAPGVRYPLHHERSSAGAACCFPSYGGWDVQPEALYGEEAAGLVVALS